MYVCSLKVIFCLDNNENLILLNQENNFFFLSAVESAGGSWYRFVVTGSIVGGRLKTPADADAESLQVPNDLYS